MSLSLGKESSKFSQEPTFKFAGSKDLASNLVDTSKERVGEGYQKKGAGFLSSILDGEGFDFEPSPTLGKLINSVRSQADYSLPQELGQARSNYMRTPAGRSAFGLDDTVLKNRITRDSMINNLLQDQYNRDLQTSMGAASGLVGIDSNNFQQALQALGSVTGSKGRGSGENFQYGTSTGDAAKIGAAFATCWVAREVYGQDNPRWLVFREWLFNDAPSWLRKLYLKRGEKFAKFISTKPRWKKLIRSLMNLVVEKELSYESI